MRLTALVVLGTLAGCSCNRGRVVDPNAVYITVFPRSERLLPGESRLFTATVVSARGETLSMPLSWASTAPAVAEVDSVGTAFALSPGEAGVTASYGSAADTAHLLVSEGSGPALFLSARAMKYDTLLFVPGASLLLVTAREADSSGPRVDGARVTLTGATDTLLDTLTSSLSDLVALVQFTGGDDYTLNVASNGHFGRVSFRYPSYVVLILQPLPLDTVPLGADLDVLWLYLPFSTLPDSQYLLLDGFPYDPLAPDFFAYLPPYARSYVVPGSALNVPDFDLVAVAGWQAHHFSGYGFTDGGLRAEKLGLTLVSVR